MCSTRVGFWSVTFRVLRALGKQFFLRGLLTFNNFNAQRNIRELKIQSIFNYILNTNNQQDNKKF